MAAKNPKVEEAARHAHEHGITTRVAAEQFGVSIESVRVAWRRLYPGEEMPRTYAQRKPRTDGLTAHQHRVACAFALGLTREEICEQFGFGGKTLDSHRLAILSTLALRNVVELARQALRRGWVTL